MRVWEIILLILMFIILLFGLYVLWVNVPRESSNFEEYNAQIASDFPAKSVQFYPNMRFTDRKISYSIDASCKTNRVLDIQEALNRISSETVLEFYISNESQIRFLCSQLAPRAEEVNHYVAGEGGPTRIVNASKFSVVYESEVSLFRAEKCDNPQIATHEILHALGFDHNSNSSSIMYPVTDCSQVLDKYIIDEINRLYAFESKADLAITYLSANRTGRYVNFGITVSNVGLKDSIGGEIVVKADDRDVKKLELGDIRVGERKTYTVTNARGPSSFENLIFEVKYVNDLDNRNNVAKIATEE